MEMKTVLKRVIKKSLKATIGWPRDKRNLIEHYRNNGMKVGANFHMLEGCIIDDSHYWLIEIGDNVIIGAGSVVTRDVQANSVYAGNPAKFICGIEDYLAKETARMSADNTFGEDYTLRQAVGVDKKAHMKRVLARDGIGFII